uniref:Uncharacterized protein n=1 Tax=Anopheles melas TaxID=34690 RepID=A0A182UHY1_9DIPT
RRWGKANRSPEYVVPGPLPPKADTIAPQPQPDRDRPGHKDRTGDPDAPGELLPTTPLSNVSPIASYLRRAAAAAVPRRRTKAKVRYGPLLPILAYSATPTGPCTPDDFRVSADDPQCLVLAQGVGPRRTAARLRAQKDCRAPDIGLDRSYTSRTPVVGLVMVAVAGRPRAAAIILGSDWHRQLL